MTVSSVATSHCKKAMKMGLFLFSRRFNSSKCKTAAKMAVARIKLLRNKREVVVRQMRRDIAMLLESRQDATARIRVEHVMREQNIMAANELIELFCELIVARLTIISKQRDCPADLKEGISSVIFAAPRCSDIPELLALRDVFEKKYGKDFVSAATDLRPNAGVNRTLIEKLSVRTPAGEVKLKILKEIAKEYQVDWDTTESEMELLKPPEELIKGPNTFVSATSMPVKQNPTMAVDATNAIRGSNSGESNIKSFSNAASAAEAAAESAKRAIAAAEAAAYLAAKDTQASCHNVNGKTDSEFNAFMDNDGGEFTQNKFGSYGSVGSRSESQRTRDGTFQNSNCSRGENIPSEPDSPKIYRRHSYNIPSDRANIKFDESDCDEEIEAESPPKVNRMPPDQRNAKMMNRRHSYNAPSAHSDIKFDESDYDDESKEVEEPARANRPPNRPAPQVPTSHVKHERIPRVHPKLPDYDALAARFEALKYHKSQK